MRSKTPSYGSTAQEHLTSMPTATLKVPRRAALTLAMAALAAPSTAFAVTAGGIVENPAGERFWSMLEQLPYAPEGAGIPLFVTGFPSCPYCLAFHREWRGKLPGIQFRWIMYGVSTDPRSADQAADVAVTCDAHVVQAYFDRTRIAPPVTSSPARIDAFNQMIHATEIIKSELLKRNIRALTSPTFLFKDSRGVGVFSGYSKESFEWLISQSRRFTA